MKRRSQPKSSRVQFEEMKLILEGMLELFVIADELESHQEVTRGKKKT